MKPTDAQLAFLRKLGMTPEECAQFADLDSAAHERVATVLDRLPVSILAGALGYIYLVSMGEAAALEQAYRMLNMRDKCDELLRRRPAG